jgi:hypothetical protein
MILGQELQPELRFHPVNGITSKKQYDEVLIIIDILTCNDETNDKNWVLLDVLVPAVTSYDDNESDLNLPDFGLYRGCLTRP